MTRDFAPNRRGSPPTRKSLLLRLKDWKDDQSWGEFHEIYRRLIYDTAMKAGLHDDEAQEVVQEVLLTIAKKIAGFEYDPSLGSFKNWLLQITRRRIIDQLRKRRPGTAESTIGHAAVNLEQLTEPGPSRLESLWNEEWHLVLLNMARALVKRRVGARQFRIFELYVLQQKPLKEVTRQLGVNAAQVYMAKYRITKLLQKELKGLEEDAV